MQSDVIEMAVERLNTSELVYHTQLIAELKRAQDAAQQAQIEFVKAQGAVDSWSKFLMHRYMLEEGDSISEDGFFTRKSP